MTHTTEIRVLICGGGRTGQLTGVLMKQCENVHVSLLTNNQTLIDFHHSHQPITAYMPDESTLQAQFDTVTNNPRIAAHDVDLILITAPADAREAILKRLQGHVPHHKNVFLGAAPGFCGFNWQAEHYFGNQPNIIIWGMKDVAHTAFELNSGVSIRMGGCKKKLFISCHDYSYQTEQAKQLTSLLNYLYQASVIMVDDYLNITLTPGNAIMHSAVIYGLIGPYGQWHNRPFQKPICWWTDINELSSYFMTKLDEENLLLRDALEKRLNIKLHDISSLHCEIVEAYPTQITNRDTLHSTLKTNQAYADIPAPMVLSHDKSGFILDKNSRAFSEDIAYGLRLLVELGKLLSIPLPYMNEIYQWCLSYMNETPLTSGIISEKFIHRIS